MLHAAASLQRVAASGDVAVDGNVAGSATARSSVTQQRAPQLVRRPGEYHGFFKLINAKSINCRSFGRWL
ncbi:hypothetical protein D7W09_07725 [bacterium D16-34]|nr:hypothetical protein D7W09_07725 [bacterium D16-34]